VNLQSPSALVLPKLRGRTHLDGFDVKAQAVLLVGQEVLDIFALIALELNHLAHLCIRDDGAIAGKLLLDHLENLFLVEFLR
jgi:hypothetical protein